jgi:hypothetical protein
VHSGGGHRLDLGGQRNDRETRLARWTTNGRPAGWRTSGPSSLGSRAILADGASKAQIEVRDAARQYTQEAIDTLVLVMRNGKPGEAAMAANSLLDRGWGKPTQQTDGPGPENAIPIILYESDKLL